MDSQHIGSDMLQRCRKMWWTVFVLDRQMTSLMGVPSGMRDRDITAQLPTFSGCPQQTRALELHIKLSKVIAKIFHCERDSVTPFAAWDILMYVAAVYGARGRVNESFVIATKSALKNIAEVTQELNAAFHMNITESSTGMSRLAAYLHLLNHQVSTCPLPLPTHSSD
jgi:hypothetical protein